MADSDFIPDAQFKPDPVPPNNGIASADFIPDSQFVSDEEKHGGLGSQIGTALEGAASAATFGLSTGLEKKIGRDLNIEALSPENIRGRRETNPISHGAGQIAGLVGSSFLVPGGGAAGLLEKAGQGAAEAVGLGAAESGLAKIGSSAVKSAVDNMLVQGGDEVSKMFAGNYADPNDAVQTAAANVGLAGLIGGGLGGAIGSISPLFKETIGKKLGFALGDMSNEAENAIANKESGALSSLPEDYLQKRMVDEASGTFKPNADEIMAASQRLGVKPTPGTLSDKEFIQNLENNLIKRPTIFGQKAAKETMEIYEGLNKAGLKTLRDATTKSEYEVGKEVKDGIVKSIQKELAPLEAKYTELEPHFKAMEVPEELKRVAIDPLLAMNDETATKLGMEINRLENVNDIKVLRTKINARIGDAVRGGYEGANEQLAPLYAAKNALTKMREDAIEVASKATGIGENEAGQISQKTISEIRDTDKGYRALKDNLRNLGREGGLGNLGSARQLLDKFSKLPDENLAKRFFDLGDVNQLKYFKEKFPEQFELARRYKLKEILENSVSEAQGKNGRFEVGKYLRQLSDTKLGPEARELLMAGHSEATGDIRTIFQALPGNANPSGTAGAISSNNLFSMQGLADNASDAVKYAVLRRLPEIMKAAGSSDAKATGLAALAFMKSGQPVEGEAFKSAVDFISHTIKGENLMGKAAKGVFDSSMDVLPTKLIPDDKSREKLDKKLKELQTNQQPLFDVGGKTAHYLPNHGQAIASTSMNAVNYLNSLRPAPQKQSPLDSEPVITKAQKASFDRALDIAQQPLVVMADIKKGTITPEDIKNLHVLYPSLYNRLSQKLNSEMIETVNAKTHIPYETRMGVSMFLGQPLDSTLTPSSIVAAQSVFNRASQQKDQSQPQAKQGGGGAHSMKSLAKLPSQYATPGQAREAQRLKS